MECFIKIWAFWIWKPIGHRAALWWHWPPELGGKCRMVLKCPQQYFRNWIAIYDIRLGGGGGVQPPYPYEGLKDPVTFRKNMWGYRIFFKGGGNKKVGVNLKKVGVRRVLHTMPFHSLKLLPTSVVTEINGWCVFLCLKRHLNSLRHHSFNFHMKSLNTFFLRNTRCSTYGKWWRTRVFAKLSGKSRWIWYWLIKRYFMRFRYWEFRENDQRCK